MWDKAADPQYATDDSLVEHVRDCYASYINGVSFAALVRRLRTAGVQTADGAEFTTGNLRATMDSGFAAGLVVRYKRHPDKGHAIQDLATNAYEQGSHEAIIGMDTWASYLAERKTRNTAPRTAYPATRISGLVRCASCGGLMSVGSPGKSKKSGARYLYFSCNRRSKARYHSSTVCSAPARIPVAKVESAVLAWAEEQVRAEASPEEALRRADAAKRARTDTKKIEAEVRRLEKQHKQLTHYLLDGTVTAETYKNTAPGLERQIADAQVSLTKARDAASAVAPRLDSDSVRLLARAWEGTAADVVRDALAQIIRRIEVMPVGQEPRITVVPRWEE